jgi:8-oxo-dGTP diphosphatase
MSHMERLKSDHKNQIRAAAVLIENGRIAMIERRRGGLLFYVFPGGHVEHNETPPDAVIREIKEELGLEVCVLRLVARSTYFNNPHLYYLVERTGGVFGSGEGKELSRSADSERGSVAPVWLSLGELQEQIVYPAQMVEIVRLALDQCWPDEVPNFIEAGE